MVGTRKGGRIIDLFTTLRLHDLPVLVATILQNLSLVRYRLAELASTKHGRLRKLRRMYPDADPAEWEFIHAGQRAQLVAPDSKRIGALKMGTETIVGADGTIAGLLGASSGASTTVSIMLDRLCHSFPDRWENGWHARLRDAIPGLDPDTGGDATVVAASNEATPRVLGLQTTHER